MVSMFDQAATVIKESLTVGDTLTFIGHSAGNDWVKVVIDKLIKVHSIKPKAWVNIAGRTNYDLSEVYRQNFVPIFHEMAVQAGNKRHMTPEDIAIYKKEELSRTRQVLEQTAAVYHTIATDRLVFLLSSSDVVFPLESQTIPARAQKIVYRGDHNFLFDQKLQQATVDDCKRLLERL